MKNVFQFYFHGKAAKDRESVEEWCPLRRKVPQHFIVPCVLKALPLRCLPPFPLTADALWPMGAAIVFEQVNYN
jgi:hypothetical protein